MRKYLMKFNDNGKPVFVDENDRGAYRALLSFIRSKGIQRFIMSIEEDKINTTSDNQVTLWNVVVGLISFESGNDRATIEQTINRTGIAVSDMDNLQFNELLNNSFILCQQYFNVELTIAKNGNIEIKKQ
jgi:hypothetical protein